MCFYMESNPGVCEGGVGGGSKQNNTHGNSEEAVEVDLLFQKLFYWLNLLVIPPFSKLKRKSRGLKNSLA